MVARKLSDLPEGKDIARWVRGARAHSEPSDISPDESAQAGLRNFSVSGYAEEGLRSTLGVRGLLDVMGIERDERGGWVKRGLTLAEARTLVKRVRLAGGRYVDVYHDADGTEIAG